MVDPAAAATPVAPGPVGRRSDPRRLLMISVLLTAFVAIVVYVVATFAFIVPRLRLHEDRMTSLERKVAELGAPAEQPAEQAAADQLEPTMGAQAAVDDAAPLPSK